MNIKKEFKIYILMATWLLIFSTQNSLASTNRFNHKSEQRKSLVIKENKNSHNKRNYIGADFSLISEMIKTNYGLQTGYGKNIYSNNPLMYGVFLGHNFNDTFGLEVAYETQDNKRKTTILRAGDYFPGYCGPLQGNEQVTVKTRVKTEHFQIMAQGILHRFSKKQNIALWTQLGMSYSHVRAKQEPISAIGGEFQGNWCARNIRTFKQRKLVPAAKVGLNYDWTDRIGVRISAGWRHLSMLKAKSNENPATKTEIRLKDGINCAIGVYLKF